MKPISSLFAKILAWFFLNLVLVVVLLSLFFAFQPHVNLHSIFGQGGVNRLRASGLLISHDLSRIPQAQWSDELARHAGIHQVDFMIVLQDGSRFTSTEQNLPEEVMLRVKRLLRHRPPKRPSPLPQNRIDSPRPHRRHLDGISAHDRALPEIPPATPEDFTGKPNFRMKTKHPTRYWSGIRLRRPLVMQRPVPAMLLAVSDSMTGNGFFFDPLPWMVAVATVILISVLFWIPAVRNITRPLARMTHAAEAIARGRFDLSIHEPRSDEIGRLARAINHMTIRLSAFVKGQRRFLSDVAHELGSPIARIQFGLGALEQRIEGENRQRLVDVMEDVDHMSKLAGELLAFSRAEIQSKAIQLDKIELLSVVQTAIRRETDSAAQILVKVDSKTSVIASSDLLTRALANLLRNAVKYAGDAGPIEVSTEKINGGVKLEIRDNGPGVPGDQLDQLFEPFFRPEASRDRDSGGVGLGLAIVKTCIESCKGTVSAANLHPKGFAVTITLTS